MDGAGIELLELFYIEMLLLLLLLLFSLRLYPLELLAGWFEKEDLLRTYFPIVNSSVVGSVYAYLLSLHLFNFFSYLNLLVE